MINLIFDVTETEVILREKTQTVTSGNIKQIKCRFNLDKTFEGLIIRAVFNGQFQNVINGECYAPMLDEGKCAIGVYGYILNDNNQYETIVSPTPTNIVVPKGSYDKRNVQSNNAPPSELEAYYSSIKKLIDNIETVQVDSELSTESSNAIANKTVANILSSGNLIGIERISSIEDFEQFQSKYEDVPATDNQYMLLFVTEDIYSGEELTLEKGLFVITPTDEYKLTCSKEFEEFKKAVEMNFNLFFQALGNYATREKLEQVKSDLFRLIELLQSQTEQKISTTNKNVLQLTARVDELEKEWITVCDDTLTEDISFLLKTTDAQGNPFNFKKLKVYIYSPLNEATGNTGVRIINGIDYSDMDNILVQTSNWFMSTLSQHCIATVDCEGFAVTETNRGPTMDKMNNTGIMGVNFNVESITSVLIRPISTTAKMIPGTRIVVKGC